MGIDRIAQATIFADLLKQAARHAAAHGGRIDLGRVNLVVAVAGAFKGQREMDLLQILDLAPLAPFELRRLDHGPAHRFQPAKDPLCCSHDGGMIDTTGSRKHHLVRPVMPGRKALEIRLAEGLHPFFRPKDRAPEGLIGIADFMQPVEDDVIRRIQRLTDFLQDDMALGLDIGLAEHGVQHDVGDHVQGHHHIARQDAGIIGCHLAAGIGVDIAAHILDLFGDPQGRAPAGALEGHVFQKMRDAVLGGRFVPPARFDPKADAGGLQTGHCLGHDAKAVGKGVQV